MATPSTIGLRTKAIIGAIIGALTVAVTALSDGDINLGEGIAIGSALLVNLLAIPFIKNADAGWAYWAKAIASGVVAGLACVAANIADHGWPLTSAEWLVAVIACVVGAGLTGAAVAIAPDAVKSDALRV
jgi:hypothetical protein